MSRTIEVEKLTLDLGYDFKHTYVCDTTCNDCAVKYQCYTVEELIISYQDYQLIQNKLKTLNSMFLPS